ncbi:DPP IV N-terminal domain-containing protein [Terriglobus roseus]|uniref:Component of the Tol biopolymer transport system n=1 Tax=Terriglobus roseus TaxID=392734 RepID=A0A1G7KI87_9BACT|nr:DPP IV N-terminal domain-containing protein [Terriglobus roseus]SDF36897.1 component of the Tol biopolymer transport system [Terriglobus roseus]
MSTEHRAPFQAGDWIVEPELNCLRKDDQEKHLEPKVMKVLLALADHPNHVVAKDDLIAAVWPGTFVSDDVLTRCISVLRRVTQDDATMPHFIQTVPKVGYRLLAPLRELPTEPSQEQVLPFPAPELARAESLAETFPQLPIPRQGQPLLLHPAVLAGLAFAILVIVVLGVWRFLWTGTPRETILKTLPFTSRDGEQLQPAFSPDGKTVAYVAVPENGGAQHIYIKSVTAETSAPVTSGPGDDFSPTWSPDGTRIGYLSSSTEGLGIYVVDIRSRATRKVFVPQSASQWEQGALTWSPDGDSLAFPDHAGSNPSSSIVLLNLKTLQSQVLTTPPDGWEGDLTPAFSPDGKRIAFSRASETAVRDLYWIAATGGQAHQITHESAGIDSLAWFPDGKSIVFSSNRGGKSALWRVFLRGGTPARMPIGTEDAAQPTVSRTGNILRVAYTQGSAIWSIIAVTRGAEGVSHEILSSTQEDSAPSFARDGLRFAFQSQRSGFQEIWMAAVDGTGAHPLTHGNGPLTGSPSWGHVHDEILFDSRIGGHSHIFAIRATGGSPQQLTNGDFNDITPRWSNDDNAVYFRSNRGGRWQLWRVDRNGGSPQPVTTGDGIVPQESPDGKFLYFARGGEAGIWRVPVQGGPETEVVSEPAAGYWGYWEVTPHGIVFLDTKQSSLRIYDPATGNSTNFAKLKRLPPRFAGLTMSPNGQQILLTDESHASRHLTLSEMTTGR